MVILSMPVPLQKRSGSSNQQDQVLIDSIRNQNRFSPSTAPTVGAVCVCWEENRWLDGPQSPLSNAPETQYLAILDHFRWIPPTIICHADRCPDHIP